MRNSLDWPEWLKEPKNQLVYSIIALACSFLGPGVIASIIMSTLFIYGFDNSVERDSLSLLICRVVFWLFVISLVIVTLFGMFMLFAAMTAG